MPRGGKDETTKTDDITPPGEMPNDNDAFGEALSRAGFKPAKIGHKIVPQGKRREMLKKRPSGNADK